MVTRSELLCWLMFCKWMSCAKLSIFMVSLLLSAGFICILGSWMHVISCFRNMLFLNFTRCLCKWSMRLSLLLRISKQKVLSDPTFCCIWLVTIGEVNYSLKAKLWLCVCPWEAHETHQKQLVNWFLMSCVLQVASPPRNWGLSWDR